MVKKIAVCYSGLIRGDLQKCFETFKKHVLDILVKKNYSIDIYIHTWNFNEKDFGKYSGKYYKDNSIEKKISIFNPKDYLIEDFKLFKIPKEMIGLNTERDRNNSPKESWHRNVSDRYGIYKVNELKNKYENIKYKYVIRNRFDNFFTKDININNLSSGKLYLSSGHLFPDSKGIFTNINNQFAISGNDIMNKFSNYYIEHINLLSLVKSNKLPTNYLYLNKIVVLHTLLFKFYICEYMKIPLTILDYNVKLLRKHGRLISLGDYSFSVYKNMKTITITQDLLDKMYVVKDLSIPNNGVI